MARRVEVYQRTQTGGFVPAGPTASRLIWIAVLVALSTLHWHPSCSAQTETTAPTTSEELAQEQDLTDANGDSMPVVSSSAPSTPGEVRFVGPDTFILLDEQGRPQPFPGMTYEDFMEAWQQLNRPRATHDPTPRFSVQELNIEGESQGNHAVVLVSLKILLMTDEVVKIPLQMGRAIIESQPPDSTSPGDQFIAYDEQNGGLVAWLRGKENEVRDLQLKVLIPLEQQGGETSLRLKLPRSVSSQLMLDVVGSVYAASTSGDAVLSERRLAGGKTRLVATGVVGDYELRWRTSQPDDLNPTSLLRAQGAIRAQLDGQSVRMDARLQVQSFGSTFDQLYVRLPPGAAYLPADGSDVGSREAPPFTIVPLEPGEIPQGGDDAIDGNWLLVRLRTRQRGPIEVSISSELAFRRQGAYQVVQLGGFEVLGAIRQFGEIALVADDQWQLNWEPRHQVRQVDFSDIDTELHGEHSHAAFKYDSQPWSLHVRVLPRATRVHVIPKYELKLLPEEAHLRAEFSYFVTGARTTGIRADMRGWRDIVATNATNDSGALIDTDIMLPTEDGTFVMRFNGEAPRGTKVVIQARRNLSSTEGELEIPLPAPRADVVGSGELVVLTPPDVALAADPSRSAGLIPEAAFIDAESVSTDPAGYHSLLYRTFLAEPTFVGTRTNRSRRVIVDVESDIQLGSESGRIEEVIHYQVAYESVPRLELQIPESLLEPESQLRVELIHSATEPDLGDAIPLEIVEFAGSADATADRTLRLVQLPLPRPILGKFDVRVSYRFKPEIDSDASPHRIEIPLAVPLDGTLGSHIATTSTLSNDVEIAATPTVSDGWQIESLRDSNERSVLKAVSTERSASLSLTYGREDALSTRTTTIEKMWLQSWFAEELQQHRCVYQFRTNEPTISVELPPAVSVGQLEVILDGAPGRVTSGQSGPVVLAVPRHSKDVVHTLELIYRQPGELGVFSRHRVTTPLLGGNQPASQTYWQVVLPEDVYVVRRPSKVTSASDWQWLGNHFGPTPRIEQANLEQWSGATSRQPPSGTERQQLFYSLGSVNSLEMLVCRRWVIVLVSSSLALALGALFIHIPELSHPSALAVLALGLVIASIAFPYQALLIAQAAALGVVIVVVSAVLRHLSSARSARRWTSGGSAVTARSPAVYETMTPSPRTSTLAGASSASARSFESTP